MASSAKFCTLTLFVIVLAASATAKVDDVTKAYVFPTWFHQFLSTVFSDEKNDCSGSFYPPVPNIEFLNGLVSSTLGPRIVGFIPMKRWLPPSNRRTHSRNIKMNQERVNDIVRILPSGIVCFGIHKLARRFPKNPFLRSEYTKAINKFIVYLNHQELYPHKIDQMF